jgi:hypothetical protein
MRCASFSTSACLALAAWVLALEGALVFVGAPVVAGTLAVAGAVAVAEGLVLVVLLVLDVSEEPQPLRRIASARGRPTAE